MKWYSFVEKVDCREDDQSACVSEERGDGEGGSLALVADVPVVCKALSY
jgi:hypothetical protein